MGAKIMRSASTRLRNALRIISTIRPPSVRKCAKPRTREAGTGRAMSVGMNNDNIITHADIINLTEEQILSLRGSIRYWMDRKPFSVIAVSKSKKQLTIQYDEVTRWENDYGQEFARNVDGCIKVLRLRKDGYYQPKGSKNVGIYFGGWSAYRDRSF